jgi:hypothetical protein
MKKPFTTITVVILALMAIAHALRLIFDWSVTLEGTQVPTWVSLLALVITACLAAGLWRENMRHA